MRESLNRRGLRLSFVIQLDRLLAGFFLASALSRRRASLSARFFLRASSGLPAAGRFGALFGRLLLGCALSLRLIFLLASAEEPPWLFLLFLLLVFVYCLRLATQKFNKRHLCAVPSTSTQLQDPSITAWPFRKSRGDLVEQLIERGDARGARGLRPLVAAVGYAIGIPTEKVGGGQPAIVERALRSIRSERTLSESDRAFRKWPELFRFWKRSNQSLVSYERSTKVTKQSQPMLCLASKFSVSNSMSHIKSLKEKRLIPSDSTGALQTT